MAYYDVDWPFENSRRYYPFAQSNNVPTGLILDLRLNATDNLPNNDNTSDTTYISHIVTDGVHVRFYMAAKIGSSVVDFGCIATADSSQGVGTRISINYVGEDNGIIFEGFLILGDTSVLQGMIPVTTLDETTGKLNTICINPMTNWIAGINVGGKTYGGVVTLEAGAGVEITPTIDGDATTLTITCTGAIPVANTSIVSDQDLYTQITSNYGIPITSINGVPCGEGWMIVVNETDGLSVVADNDTKSITINNANAVACCTQDDIQVLVDNISDLNERAGILQSFQTQLETNLNILSAQMARVL